jgi:hypothetical protein
MKSVFRLFLASLVALTFAGVSFTQATPATPATPASPEKKAEIKQEKPKASRITGEIVSLDAKAGTLTVKANGKEMSFTADTKGAKSALEKVKVGEQVRISYAEKGGKLVARSVTEAKAKTVAKAKTETKGKSETKATEKKAEKKEEPKAEKK